MNLYLLTREDWGCDEYDAFLVRATSKKKARIIASLSCGDEGKDAWMSKKTSTCQIIKAGGVDRIIISSFNAG
jgi:hypothetical protein